MVKASYDVSVNSLHALLRLMCRDDVKHSVRMLGLATAPWACDSARVQKSLKGPFETARIMSEWANSSWMTSCVECIRTTTDWASLERCGIPTTSQVPSILRGSEKVAAVDAELNLEDTRGRITPSPRRRYDPTCTLVRKTVCQFVWVSFKASMILRLKKFPPCGQIVPARSLRASGPLVVFRHASACRNLSIFKTSKHALATGLHTNSGYEISGM